MAEETLNGISTVRALGAEERGPVEWSFFVLNRGCCIFLKDFRGLSRFMGRFCLKRVVFYDYGF